MNFFQANTKSNSGSQFVRPIITIAGKYSSVKREIYVDLAYLIFENAFA